MLEVVRTEDAAEGLLDVGGGEAVALGSCQPVGLGAAGAVGHDEDVVDAVGDLADVADDRGEDACRRTEFLSSAECGLKESPVRVGRFP